MSILKSYSEKTAKNLFFTAFLILAPVTLHGEPIEGEPIDIFGDDRGGEDRDGRSHDNGDTRAEREGRDSDRDRSKPDPRNSTYVEMKDLASSASNSGKVVFEKFLTTISFNVSVDVLDGGGDLADAIEQSSSGSVDLSQNLKFTVQDMKMLGKAVSKLPKVNRAAIKNEAYSAYVIAAKNKDKELERFFRYVYRKAK